MKKEILHVYKKHKYNWKYMQNLLACTFLLTFRSRTKIKIHNILKTPKFIKKVLTNLNSSKIFSFDCISVMVLNDCKPKLSYKRPEFSNKYLKEYCFSNCWKISSVACGNNNFWERCTAKNYHYVCPLCVVSNMFQKLINKKLVNYLKNGSHFCNFRYGFRFSYSTTDLLRIVPDRITRVFNRFGVTRAIAFDFSKDFDSVWFAALMHQCKSDEISVRAFGLILPFLRKHDFVWFWMGTIYKNIQLILMFLKDLLLALYFSYYTLMAFLMIISVTLLSILMILLPTVIVQ